MQRIVVHTGDGARLTLGRYAPAVEPADAPPVVLQHGLGCNRFAFDFPGRSLALHLSQRGFDVFVTELRGAGRSKAPAKSWTLDDYLTQDVPAVISRVLIESGAPQLTWIGHSLGGILLMCHLMLQPDAPIAAGMTIGSALHYGSGSSEFQGLEWTRPIASRMRRVPYGWFARALSPFMGRPFWTPVEKFNFWLHNAEPEVVRYMHARCFGWIPIALLDDLSAALDERGLRTRDGFYFNDETARMRAPVYLVGGTRDVQAPPDTVLETADRLGDACAGLKLFGKRHGQREEYGHFDLIVGRHARREVWPFIEDWLRRAPRESRKSYMFAPTHEGP